MRIDYNIHLDYSDVLLHPKRSTLSSRRDVDILRKFKFEPYFFGSKIVSCVYRGNIPDFFFLKKGSLFLAILRTSIHWEKSIK